MKKKQNKTSPAISWRYLLYDITLLSGIPALLFFRPKKYYLNDKAKKKIKGGALVISNHISLFDPMYLMMSLWYRRHHFIAMKELFRTKFTKWLFSKGFLCIEIDRENISIQTFKNIVNHLKLGEMVTMFPEGHISLNNETQTFKTGMVMMALQSKCPIVPIYIKKRKKWYSRLEIAVGEAINISDFKSGPVATIEDINKATAYLQEQEKKLEMLCKGEK